MKPNTIISLDFYQHLGKLYYAIAAADGYVREAEINQLKDIVKKEWLAVEDTDDRFGTDAAYQIEIVFDWLTADKEYNSNECYNDFLAFKKDQLHLFTEDINRLILKTANAIAKSFSGKNKSELMLLAKLHLELLKK